MTGSLVHGSLIASFKGGYLDVIPQASLLVASLVLTFATNNIEDECVAGYLDVRLDLEYVTSLDAAPVGHLKALAALAHGELFNNLAVDVHCSFSQLAVMLEVEHPADEERNDEEEDDVAVVRCLPVARNSLSQDVYQ